MFTLPKSIIEPQIERSGFSEIYEKILNGQRLSKEDGLTLFNSNDINSIGYLANLVRERLHGDVTYFVKNQNINYTNVCVLNCSFCGFKRKPGQEGAWTFSVDEIVEKVVTEAKHGVNEIHIVGGLHPSMPYEYYLSMMSEIKRAAPQVYIKAFTMIEVDHFAKKFGKSHKEILSDFKEAGLDCMPGGGAEIFAPRVRKKLCPEKETGAEWIAIARTAHELGIKTNCTMLYGHIENYEDRVDHMLDLRNLQDETNGFFAFIPLAYQPNTPGFSGDWTSGIDNLKTLAIGRLLLDNIPHIKCFWIMHSTQVAQISLFYGVNDIDGTVTNYTITKAAGAQDKTSLTQQQMVKLIKDSGRTPIERDTFYNTIEIY